MIRAVLAIAALLTVAALAAAQDPTAPPLSAEAVTLYAHHDAADTEEKVGWMNALDKDGDDTALGTSATCQTHTGTQAADDVLLAAAGTAASRDYTFTIQPTQGGLVTLDAAGQVKFTIHFGAGSCFGNVDIKATLKAGETVIAEGSATGHKYTNAAGAYPAASISVAPAVTEFQLSELVWNVQVTGKWGGAGFMGMASSSADTPRGSSRVELPIVSVGSAGPDVEDVTGSFERTVTFNDTTGSPVAYNWTTEAGEYLLNLTGSLANGSVTVSVLNGNDTVVALAIDGNATASEVFAVDNGTYTVLVTADAATGDATIGIGPAPAPSIVDDEGGEESGESNETAGPQSTPTTEPATPLPLFVGLAALAAAVALRRRA